jgi:hypothetical protein
MSEKTQMQELTTCCFCGSESVEAIPDHDEDGPMFWVYCGRCEAQGPVIYSVPSKGHTATPAEAIAAWNTRATATPTEGEDETAHDCKRGDACYLGDSYSDKALDLYIRQACEGKESLSMFDCSLLGTINALRNRLRTRTPQPTATPTEGEDVHEFPAISYATVRGAVNRDGEDELHIECRFVNGEKSAPIVVDDGYDELADFIAKVLSAHTTSVARTPQPTDAARAEAHADELSRISAAHEWCAQRGVTVTYFWVHGVPRVSVRVFGGVPMAERYTFVEAVEAARAEDDRLTEARAIAAARKEG